MGLKTFIREALGKKDKKDKKLNHKEGKNKKKDKKKKHDKKNYKSRGGAVLVADEEFHRIKDECYDAVQEIIDEGEQYFDEEFNMYDEEACIQTIYGENPQHDFSMNDFQDSNYQLRRLTDIYGDLDLSVFYDGATATDIVQGGNGTCFYMGALMCVAEHQKFLNQLLVHYSIELGVYGIMFFADGEWTYVIIDDWFPFDEDDEPYLSQSVDKNELWVSLFEKAYAKLYGSFDMVDGGWGSSAVIDLTGGIPITLENSWEALDGAMKSSCYCLPCCLKVAGTDKDRIDNGLIPGHVYSVLNTVECDGVRLVNVRNPHGCGEWTGDYSDNSKKWTPRLKQACKHVSKDDGSFWMTYRDFDKWFALDSTRLFTKDYSYSKLLGESYYDFELDEEEDEETTKLNHLYYEGFYMLDLHESAHVAVCLSQADPGRSEDWDAKRNDLFAMGFTVIQVNCDGEDVFEAYENGEYSLVYDSGDLSDIRDLAMEIDLSSGVYIIVPRFDYAGCTYAVRLFTNSPSYEFEYYYYDGDDEEDEDEDEEEEEEEEEEE